MVLKKLKKKDFHIINYKLLNSKHSNSRLHFHIMDNWLLKCKRSQIWVETIIYILIGLSIITVLLVMIIPKIDKMKDRMLVEQTISAMNDLDNKILEIKQVSGNIRVVDFRISKGKIEIDSANDLIIYVLEDTKAEMSEPGVEITQGSVVLKTEAVASKFKVTLTMKYDSIDITFGDKQETKVLNAGAVPYKIIIENAGIGQEDKTNINVNVV